MSKADTTQDTAVPEQRTADLTNIQDVQSLIVQLSNEVRQHEAQANLAQGQIVILRELEQQLKAA